MSDNGRNYVKCIGELVIAALAMKQSPSEDNRIAFMNRQREAEAATIEYANSSKNGQSESDCVAMIQRCVDALLVE
jgi:hypothetical protein